MPGNSIGKALILTSFGESHGVAVGGVLDGYPSNIEIDPEFIKEEAGRRRPGLDPWASPRSEEDEPEFLSGLYQGRSTGAPITFLIRNKDQRPGDYSEIEQLFRPSHADFTWKEKFGIRDPRGGGRSSARETVVRVVAGALAKIFLKTKGISITSGILSIGRITYPQPVPGITDPAALSYLEELKNSGDTTGGIVSCTVSGVPAGLGEPVFDKLQASLARAILSINAVKGFEYGEGFRAASMKGSEHNDPFVNDHGTIRTASNHSGGIQGGISNGEEIRFNVAFKPVPTIRQDQQTVNTSGEPAILYPSGRHDVCVVPRALVIVEAMAALVIADHIIQVGQVGQGM